MRKMRLGFVTWIVVCGIILAGGISDLQAADYEITITNLTRAQVITPPVVFSHTVRFSVFRVGEQAKAVVAQLAESGNGAPLMSSLMTFPPVYDVVGATQLVLPGESLTLTVSTSESMNYITALGMLAQTNDGFFAIRMKSDIIHWPEDGKGAGPKKNSAANPVPIVG